LVTAIGHIEFLSDQLDLSVEIRLKSAEIICEAFYSGTTDGRCLETIAACGTSLGAQQDNSPVPDTRLRGLLDVRRKEYNSCLKAIQSDVGVSMSPRVPVDYLPFLTSELNLGPDHVTQAKSILELDEIHANSVGKNPVGVAGSAVYITQDSSKQYTQRVIADTGGVSVETIRKRTKEIRKVKNYDEQD